MGHGNELLVTIMPWICLEHKVKIGNVYFRPWKEARVGMADVAVRDTIQRYVDCFVDHQGKTVETVSICSYEGKEFRGLTDSEWHEMRCARDALVFSVICPQVILSIRGSSIGLCSTERFQTIGQQLKPGETMLYMKSGYNTTFGQFKIQKPLAVSNRCLAQPKFTLVNAFNRVFADNFPRDPRRRLFRSLEWFRLAHVEADQVSEFSRIVMMATAFETLLGISPREKDKSMFFAKEVERSFRTEESAYETRKHKKCGHTYTKAAWWAYDFYKLRNKIVHGDDVQIGDTTYSGYNRQKDVADLVLYQMLFKILCERGCVDYPENMSHFSPRECVDCLLSMDGFDEAQQVLGWISIEQI